MKLIGTVGRIGAGKDTVINYLHRRCGLPIYSLGDMVRDAARKEQLELNRENLQEIAQLHIEQYGEDIFIRRLIDKLTEEAPAGAGISGIRKPLEAETFRNQYGMEFILVHVRVKDPEIRFRRIRQRHAPRDPEELEEFLIHDQREEDMFQISKTIGMADEVLSNDSSLEDLHHQVEKNIIEPYLTEICP
ncbi:MAG: AAA family ATPase [Pelovirga sp.]